MNDQDKSRAELIKELQELRQNYLRLKSSREKDFPGPDHKEDDRGMADTLFHDVQKLANIGVWEWDKATDRVTWSDVLFQIAGMDASFPAPTFAEHSKIYTTHSWRALEAAVENALNTGEPYRLELEMIRPDGTIRNLNAYGGARFDDSKQTVTGLFGLVQDITELRRTERALRESEINFEKVINTMVETFSIINGEGVFLFANAHAAHNLSGGKVNDIKGRNIRDFVPPEQAHQFIEAYQKVISTGETVTEERKVTLGDSDKWFFNTLQNIQYGPEKMPAVLSISLDITESKNTESDLRLSEERNRLLSSVTMEGILIHRNGIAKEFNLSVLKMFGCEREALIGKNFLEFVHPDDLPLVKENIAKDYALPYEVKAHRKNGEKFFLEIESRNFHYQGEQWRVSALRDITWRKQTEDINRTMAVMVNTAPSAITIHDAEGHFLYSNQKNLELHGYSEPEFMAMNLHDLDVPESEAMLAERFRLIAKQGFGAFEVAHYRRDGTIIPLEIFAKTVEWQGTPAVLSIATDITERKQAEKALISSEKELKKAQQITHIGNWNLDLETNEVKWTEELYKMYGFDPSLPPPPYTEHKKLFTPESWDLLSSSLARTTETGIPYELELQTVRKDGTHGWMWVRGEAMQDPAGKIVGLWGAAQDITQRKLSEEELKTAKERAEKSEEKFRNYIQSSPTSIFLADENGKYLFVNNTACKLLGYTTDEMLQRSIRDITVSIPSHDTMNNFLELKEKGEVHNVEKQLIRKDGEVIDVILDGTKLSENEYIAFVKDITERKKTENEIIIAKKKADENELKFRLMYENTSIGIALISLEYEIAGANKAYCDMLGYTENELIGKKLHDITHPDIIDKNMELQLKLKQGLIPSFQLEKSFIHKNGQTVYGLLTATLIKNTHNEPSYFLGNVQDITSIKRAQERLKTSEEKFRKAFYTSPDALIINRMEDGIGVSVNKGFMQITGYSEKEAVGPDARLNIWVDRADREKLYHLLKTNGIVENQEAQFRMKDGSIIDGLVSATMIELDGIPHIMSITRDISKIKQYEMDLIKAKERAEESDRLKSAFLANMSHEIRTPMNGILGFAELLKEPNLSGDEQKEYIRIIEKSGARMLNVINEIVDISKIEAGLMEIDIRDTNVTEMMEFMAQFFKPEIESKGLVFSFRKSFLSQEIVIQTDKEKLQAILLNLIKNAVKYTKYGSIEIGYFQKTPGVLGLFEEQGELGFFVKDTGIGIPTDRQKAIFERFIQADVPDKNAWQGAGLGLSISKAYVEMLGGRIWVDSQEGIGSTFYFTIPCNHEKQNKDLFSQQAKALGWNRPTYPEIPKLKILIVEDDEPSTMLLAEIVREISVEILYATTGVQAIDQCRKNLDTDVVLMDVRMPEMDGYEAIRQIRRFNKEIVIIAQTAHGLTGDREKSIAAGADGYVSKPIKKDELLKLIQAHFNR